MPAPARPPSRIGFAKLTEAAVLSITIATVFGARPAVSASLRMVGSACLACSPPGGEV
jgi:hypothetical protein